MAEKDALLEEYRVGNELAQVYFKGVWTVGTIFIPISFALVAVSYAKETLTLTSEKMIPLAGASIFLYLYFWAHARRYSRHAQSIWERLREIEAKKGMGLHLKIDKDDKARRHKWRLMHINFILLLLLLALWIHRILFSPFVSA